MKSFLRKVYNLVSGRKAIGFSGSPDYWESRYKSGGNSGTGSYDRLAEFKAEILNEFVAQNNIDSVLEFGCGDGNQLSLATYPKYIGFDVSKSAIQLCKRRFANDTSKSFFLYDSFCFVDNANVFKVDASFSLDVIYHLVEDEVFHLYMQHLFSVAQKYVVIYSSNFDSAQTNHERNREFTKWVEANKPEWKLVKKINNRYPVTLGEEFTSKADFYIYGKN